jgi:UDP-2,3-diacylglucosamine pyrophosphatase LpxH
MQTTHHHTLWLSDIHLGNKDCKAEYLLTFLNSITVDTLYLVGDIVDMWQMSKQFKWPDTHNQVMHKFMHMSENGTRVIYLPGNHDAPLQSYSGMAFGNIEIVRQCVHTTLQGKRYLVLHGDQFDGDVTLGKFHSWVGDKGYDLLLFLNRWYNRFQRWRKREYWSLAGYIKKHIKGANLAISRYRTACCLYAKRLELDGVICGHIHHPQSEIEDGIHYVNDGDWVENCTALSEDMKGNLTLVYFLAIQDDTNVTPIKNNTAASEAA